MNLKEFAAELELQMQLEREENVLPEDNYDNELETLPEDLV